MTSSQKSFDLEARFIKRYSPAKFTALLSVSVPLQRMVTAALRKNVQQLLEEVSAKEGSVEATISLHTKAIERFLLTGPTDRALHRALYQQSQFFGREWYALTYKEEDGRSRFKLAQAEGAARAVRLVSNKTLTPIDEYVLLHMMPYILLRWREESAQNEVSGIMEALGAIVSSKVAGIEKTMQTDELEKLQETVFDS